MPTRASTGGTPGAAWDTPVPVESVAPLGFTSACGQAPASDAEAAAQQKQTDRPSRGRRAAAGGGGGAPCSSAGARQVPDCCTGERMASASLQLPKSHVSSSRGPNSEIYGGGNPKTRVLPQTGEAVPS